jgi:aryl-alcohol dehydrogenase-like predicted oxidoreductase
MSRVVAGREAGDIGLGCMGMTWAYGAAERDETESFAVIHRALEIGVTLLDTADMYGPYTNEELVGRAIEGRRDEVVLATKCGLVVEDVAEYVLRRDGRPEHVRAAVEGSLRRLRTDFIDLYQLHRVDPEVPLEDTWGAMAELVTEGKVGALGMSEVGVAELECAHAIHPVASVQSEGSLWTRDAFAEVVPWCAAHGAAFLPFAPLGRGFLTGKLEPQKFPAGDFRKNNPRFQPEAMEANLALVERVRAVAERRGATPAQVALAWLLAQGEHIVPIPGTKRRERLEENAAAADLQLTPADLAELSALPAPVGERY